MTAKKRPAKNKKAQAKPKVLDTRLATLKPYDLNPRDNARAIHDVAMSLREFGAVQPIVVDADNVIIIGHTRYQAALSEGWTTFPTLKVKDLDEAQVKALRIADNKTGEGAKWNQELLKGEFESLKAYAGDAPAFTGFSSLEVDKMFQPEVPRKADDLYGGATAIQRGSAPRRFWETQKLVAGSVLDVGGGLDEHDYLVYDIKTQPDPAVLLDQYDVVMCNYVLNVQPTDHLVDMILALLYNLVIEDGKVLIACVDTPNLDYKAACGFRKHKTAGEWLKMIERFFVAERADANFCGFICTKATE